MSWMPSKKDEANTETDKGERRTTKEVPRNEVIIRRLRKRTLSILIIRAQSKYIRIHGNEYPAQDSREGDLRKKGM